MDYDTAIKQFRDDEISDLAKTPEGLRFLKLKTLSRKEHLQELLQAAGVEAVSDSAAGLLKEAVESDVSNDVIASTISSIFARDSKERLENESELVSELYKMSVFDWGGLHQNSLEKTIVDSYVKKIKAFDKLEGIIEGELHQSMKGFVLCQWYNHWTTIIIEDIFNTHKRVTPAVGKVKKIDFFIDDVPFDLKVTFLPEGFIKKKRQDAKLGVELTLARAAARSLKIAFDNHLSDGKLLEDLMKKLDDHPDPKAQNLCKSLGDYRMELLSEVMKDPLELMRWLYEEQGIRRFDAANRLFLILVDTSDFFDSWKLKRAKPFLAEQIKTFLDGLQGVPGRDLTFKRDGLTYQCRAEICFVVKPRGAR